MRGSIASRGFSRINGKSQILADQRGGARVGLAVANDSDQPGSFSVTAYNNSGQQVAATSLTHRAFSSGVPRMVATSWPPWMGGLE